MNNIRLPIKMSGLENLLLRLAPPVGEEFTWVIEYFFDKPARQLAGGHNVDRGFSGQALINYL